MVSDRVDIVLTEGYRGAAARKVEVSRAAHSHTITARLDDLVAIVTDEPFDYPVPQFGLDDAEAVADFFLGLGLPRRAPGAAQSGELCTPLQ
jgi:molybdopterin-guanine dinucleotide biosynthesis protein